MTLEIADLSSSIWIKVGQPIIASTSNWVPSSAHSQQHIPNLQGPRELDVEPLSDSCRVSMDNHDLIGDAYPSNLHPSPESALHMLDSDHHVSPMSFDFDLPFDSNNDVVMMSH